MRVIFKDMLYFLCFERRWRPICQFADAWMSYTSVNTGCNDEATADRNAKKMNYKIRPGSPHWRSHQPLQHHLSSKNKINVKQNKCFSQNFILLFFFMYADVGTSDKIKQMLQESFIDAACIV